MNKPTAILAGLVIGAAYMFYVSKKSTLPASVWTPMIDIPSFIVGGSLWFVPGAWAPFVGGLIVGIHAVQLKTNL